MLAMTPAWMLRSAIAAAGNALCPYVEVPGIEPGSVQASSVLLRVEPRYRFSAPVLRAALHRAAQPLLVFPPASVTEAIG